MMIDDEYINFLMSHPKEARVALLSSLELYARVFHYYLNKTQFIVKDFHRKIIRKLEDMVFQRNEKNNLYIGMCPRSGKSQISLYFEGWGFAHNPHSNYLSVSYGGELIKKFSKQVRDMISSPLYGKLFNLYIERDTSASDLWKTTSGGEYRATTLQGTITGFGAGQMRDGWGGCIVIDDFLKAQDANSVAEKRKVIDCYENTIKSRKNNPNTPVVIIAQRLATDDLIGFISENEKDDWDLFVVPTLDEKDISIWEDKFPSKKLVKMRKNNPFLYYSQYQQEPIVLGGSVIKEEWFRFHPMTETKYMRLFMTADTAMKTKEYNDFSVIGYWGQTYNNELHLLDMIKGKWEAPDLEKQLIMFWNKHKGGIYPIKPNAVYIEDKASGTGLIQSVKRKGMPVIPFKPEADKLTRVRGVTPYIEAGMLYLPIGKSYDTTREVINECVAFTENDSHEHDDIVDMMVIALNVAYQKSPMRISEEVDKELDFVSDLGL